VSLKTRRYGHGHGRKGRRQPQGRKAREGKAREGSRVFKDTNQGKDKKPKILEGKLKKATPHHETQVGFGWGSVTQIVGYYPKVLDI